LKLVIEKSTKVKKQQKRLNLYFQELFDFFEEANVENALEPQSPQIYYVIAIHFLNISAALRNSVEILHVDTIVFELLA